MLLWRIWINLPSPDLHNSFAWLYRHVLLRFWICFLCIDHILTPVCVLRLLTALHSMIVRIGLKLRLCYVTSMRCYSWVRLMVLAINQELYFGNVLCTTATTESIYMYIGILTHKQTLTYLNDISFLEIYRRRAHICE